MISDDLNYWEYNEQQMEWQNMVGWKLTRGKNTRSGLWKIVDGNIYVNYWKDELTWESLIQGQNGDNKMLFFVYVYVVMGHVGWKKGRDEWQKLSSNQLFLLAIISNISSLFLDGIGWAGRGGVTFYFGSV